MFILAINQPKTIASKNTAINLQLSNSKTSFESVSIAFLIISESIKTPKNN